MAKTITTELNQGRGMTATEDAEPRARRARTDTRQRLVDAATDLMWRHGIGEVSVDMILDRADVLKGSFYHFFPAKADLLLECLDNVWRRQSEQLAAIHAEAKTPQEALQRHLDMMAQAQVDGNAALGFVPGTFNMSMPTSLLREDARITGKLQELMDSNLHYLESGLKQAAGPGASAKAVEAAARVLSYMVAGSVMTARMKNALKPLDDFPEFLRLALSAVSAPG